MKEDMKSKFQASTESAEEGDEDESIQGKHQETFQCLTTCTEWYIVAQVGNSSVKIPAKNCSVRYSENPQELPILTREHDPIDCLVNKEEQCSCSEKPVTLLNRPVNAGNNPSSSNNTSNNGYRKKHNV